MRLDILTALYSAFLSWHLDPFVVLGLLASECLYLGMVQRLWRKAGNYDQRAAIYWSLGLCIIFSALESPIDVLGEQNLFSAHMLQHELLLSVAPPLLLLGLSPRLVVPFTRPIFKPLLRNHYTHTMLRCFFSPYCTLALWLGLIYVWHIPTLYMLALNNRTSHILEHFSFIVAGMLFWQTLIEPFPGLVKLRPLSKIGYLMAAQVGMVPLIATFLWSPALLYPYYQWHASLWGIPHIFDQQLAGVVMMLIEMSVALIAVTSITLKALAVEEWQAMRYRKIRSAYSSETEYGQAS